ncbi:uncharacterized protein LOC127798169 [Diospyros lotus]|uniref:uncharacterized protein LOC127798169 n=1 Tax=Diospyros lotus TaxID=55363 RepID=UPI002253DB97|nr:uncharacterized protein LOC127798169 [Diospyros lotus]
MNGAQYNRTCDLEKPFLGCLGRMVNLFDLNTGVAGNRLLTEKPHRDGSPVSSGQSDAASVSQFGDHMKDKKMVTELRSCSNKKSNGTPVRMLIGHEMKKEVDSKHNPPNVIAKLMGLDTLPQHQPDPAGQRTHSRGYSQSHLGNTLDYWQEEYGLRGQLHSEIHQCPVQDECKDVYEILQQSQNRHYFRDISPAKERHNNCANGKKMALVRQKFIEAKCLVTDDKLRQSKQFQDALEVLSSNNDLVLKFLQESNSLFSQNCYDLHSIPPPADTKQITVLRPSKLMGIDKLSEMGKRNEKEIKKAFRIGQVIGWDKSNPGFSPPNWRANDSPTQPTRIVVLKPSPGDPHDIKAMISPSASSPTLFHGKGFCGQAEDCESQQSRGMAKGITRQMLENLSEHQRDKTLLSSVFSNGHTGDKSSFNKSENEYTAGNVSDSEAISPTSRHSWDYINRPGTPYSSSLSHASCSPESSVSREAKKRLSERWALVASHGNCQEQTNLRRSSSTLGEMLALSDAKKFVRSKEKGIRKEQERRGSTSCFANDLNKDKGLDDAPSNLLRSKSVPVSSTLFGDGLNGQHSDIEDGKMDSPKEVAAKPRSVKSSLKGKVTSLFFSRNKKSHKEKSSAYRDESQKSAEMPIHAPEKIIDVASRSSNNSGAEGGPLFILQGSTSKESLPLMHDISSPKAGLSKTKSENQEQPSPISVLELHVEEDDNITPVSRNVKEDRNGQKLPAQSIKFKLIDKSPPIESMARTLSWDDDSCVETGTSYSQKPSLVSQGAEEEEQEWVFFVQSLLSSVGLDGKVQKNSFFVTWHLPESPLDPSLRDVYIDLNDKEIACEAARRQRRSTQKLVFDCVNAALVDMTRDGWETNSMATPCDWPAQNQHLDPSSILVDQVWTRLEEWFSWKGRCAPGDVDADMDGDGQVVEALVRNEVVGKGLAERVKLEKVGMGKELEAKLLDELVQEAVIELTGNECYN